MTTLENQFVTCPVFVPEIKHENADYWSAMIDLMRDRFDDGFSLSGRFAAKDARRGGRNAPTAWTETDLDNNRNTSRLLYDSNDYVTGLIDSLVNYTCQRGFQWTPYREGQEATSAAADLPPELLGAKLALDSFKRRDRWRSRQREIEKRSHRDGDAFVRLFRSAPGRPPAARFAEPELVCRPLSADGGDQGAWSFGVLTHPDDVEKPLAYHVRSSNNPSQDCEAVLAGGLYPEEESEAIELIEKHSRNLPIGPGRMFHFKRNVDRTVKRGMPTLIAAAIGYQSAAKLLRNIMDTSALNAAIYMIRQHVGGTQASVSSFAQNFATSGTIPIGQARGSFGGIVPRNVPAAAQAGAVVIDSTDQTNYLPGPVNTGTQSYLMANAAQLRKGAVRVNAPEYLASGDASNANFASTKEAGSPFIVATEGRQQDLADFEQDIAEAVLAMSRPTDGQSFAGVCVAVQPPPVAIRSQLEETQQYQIEHQEGVLSAATWQKNRGYKPEVEDANLAKEREQNPDMGQMLTMGDGLDKTSL